jgi:hypothetical protein
VELFFKWIKQHLRIKAFFGTNENAVKTQIWIATGPPERPQVRGGVTMPTQESRGDSQSRFIYQNPWNNRAEYFTWFKKRYGMDWETANRQMERRSR